MRPGQLAMTQSKILRGMLLGDFSRTRPFSFNFMEIDDKTNPMPCYLSCCQHAYRSGWPYRRRRKLRLTSYHGRAASPSRLCHLGARKTQDGVHLMELSLIFLQHSSKMASLDPHHHVLPQRLRHAISSPQFSTLHHSAKVLYETCQSGELRLA